MDQPQRIDRRSFLRQAAGTGLIAPAFVKNLISAPPSGKLRLASFGANGMAWDTLDAICAHPNVTLAAVAEVDKTRTDKVQKKYPDAKLYQDWRAMIDRSEERRVGKECRSRWSPQH